MAELVLMPKLGFNMESGQLVKWHKSEADSVQKGEALFDVLTDKTVMTIESTVSGFLRKILAQEEETIPVFLPIGIIGAQDEDIGPMIKEALALLGKTEMVPGADPDAGEKAPAKGARQGEPRVFPQGKLKLSPRAKKYIQENQIDISKLDLTGTGFQEGITADDIEAYVKRQRTRVTPLALKIATEINLDLDRIAGTGHAGKIIKADVEGVVPLKGETAPAQVDPLADRRILRTISYSGMRKIIGDRLSHSMFTAPHVYFTTSIEMDKLIALRLEVNSCQEQKISLNDFIAVAVIKALQKYPELNSTLQGDKIIQYADVNLGVAVGLETGLIVPVIKKAQDKKITQIALETQDLIDKARKGKLLPDEYKGGTFTISNLGMFGIGNFTAIINPPEAGILSISAAKKTPVVVEEAGVDKVLIKSIMQVTLSVDHRIIDGLMATRFINQIKALVEKPISIII